MRRATVEAQAEFKAAHEPILDELFKRARADGKHEPREAYAFDALIEMARRAIGQAGRDRARREAEEAAAREVYRDPPARSRSAAAGVGRG